MKQRYLLLIALHATPGLLSFGCGGSTPDAKTTATAEVEIPPLDELKSISTDLQADVASLTKPIDDVQAILDELSSLPKKYGFNVADMAAMASATVESGKVEVKADLNLAADAQTEVAFVLKKLEEICVGIRATPDKVAALSKKLAADTAKVPVLASKVSVSTALVTGNPFSASEARAKAKADAAALAQVEKEVNKTISDTQAKIVGIPSMATNALAKLTASLSGGLSTG